MKKLKIKSITSDTNIQALLDNALEAIINDKDHLFVDCKSNAKKRSFVINKPRLQQMKIFLAEKSGVTQDILIYNAIIKALS